MRVRFPPRACNSNIKKIMPKEIERKFLLDRKILDFLSSTPSVDIEQGYLTTGDSEVRIRKITKKTSAEYKLTIKNGSGLVREEEENDISWMTYLELSRLSSATITKTRFCLEGFEIDVYHAPFTLVVGEFEMEHEHQQVYIPDWMQPFFVREITGEPMYANVNLARLYSAVKRINS